MDTSALLSLSGSEDDQPFMPLSAAASAGPTTVPVKSRFGGNPKSIPAGDPAGSTLAGGPLIPTIAPVVTKVDVALPHEREEMEEEASAPPPPDSGAPCGERLQHWVRYQDGGYHIFFFSIFIAMCVFFLTWALLYIQDGGVKNDVILLILVIVFGLFMAFNIGGNDVANSFGTSVGAGTVTVKQALLIAAVFEVAGATLAGGAVTNTIRSGIVNLGIIDLNPNDFMFMMMASLLSAATWLMVASWRGWPVSTTHSIVGGVIGAAITIGQMHELRYKMPSDTNSTFPGNMTNDTSNNNSSNIPDEGSALAGEVANPWDIIQWKEIIMIVVSWVTSPLSGAIVAGLIYYIVKKTVLDSNARAEAQLASLEEERQVTIAAFQKQILNAHPSQQPVLALSLAYDAIAIHDEKEVNGADARLKRYESDMGRALADIRRRVKKLQSYRALELTVPMLAATTAVVMSSMLLFKGLKNLDLGLTDGMTILIIAGITGGSWIATLSYVRGYRGKPLNETTTAIFRIMQLITACCFAFSHGSNDIANAMGPFAGVLDVLHTGRINSKSAATPLAALLSFGIALITGLWFTGRTVIMTVGTKLTEMHPVSGFAAELGAALTIMIASVVGMPVSSTHILIGSIMGIGVINRELNWKMLAPIGLACGITVPIAGSISALFTYLLGIIF